MEYCSPTKSGDVPFAATWMNPEIVMLSEVGQTERGISCDVNSMWNLKKKEGRVTNGLIYKSEIDSHT